MRTRLRGVVGVSLAIAAGGGVGVPMLTAKAVASASIPIAYDSSATGPGKVVSLDGSNVHHLGPASVTSPAWRPDGSSLVMSTFGGANLTGMAVVRADGSSTNQLSALGGNPTYSPDGTQLMYWMSQGSNKELIVIANADGTNAHVLWDDTLGVLSADLGFPTGHRTVPPSCSTRFPSDAHPVSRPVRPTRCGSPMRTAPACIRCPTRTASNT